MTKRSLGKIFAISPTPKTAAWAVLGLECQGSLGSTPRWVSTLVKMLPAGSKLTSQGLFKALRDPLFIQGNPWMPTTIRLRSKSLSRTRTKPPEEAAWYPFRSTIIGILRGTYPSEMPLATSQRLPNSNANLNTRPPGWGLGDTDNVTLQLTIGGVDHDGAAHFFLLAPSRGFF